eukprot:Gb_25717 [translate_table: standard]
MFISNLAKHLFFNVIKHDVFLCFRGPDVRKSFVDHLYHSLTISIIDASLDTQNLNKGHGIASTLENAISGARSSGSKVPSCKSASLKVMGGFNESLSRQVAETWDEGKVTVDGLEFIILEDLITEVSSLSKEGEIIYHEKNNQVEQLTRFIREDETFYWLQSGITRESLHAPWDRVAIQIMKYLTLEEKSIKVVKAGKGKIPLHQGLLKLLVNLEKGSVESSGLADDEDSPSEDCGTSVGKKGISRKRKMAPQTLSAKEEKIDKEDIAPEIQKGKEKVSDLAKETKDSAKVLYDNQRVLKELRSHLKILNGLGGSLTGTCTCINLLTLEIANCLKEVVSRLKEMNTRNS